MGEERHTLPTELAIPTRIRNTGQAEFHNGVDSPAGLLDAPEEGT